MHYFDSTSRKLTTVVVRLLVYLNSDVALFDDPLQVSMYQK